MWQRLRPVLFWLHLSLGLTTSVVVLLLCVTGALLAVELQVTQWADRQLVEPSGEPQGLPSVETLAPALQRDPAKLPQQITVGVDARDPLVVSLGRREQAYLNPWTGEDLGEGAQSVRSTFRSLMTFHRWFSLEGDARDTGRAITGVSTLFFVALILTGLVLWAPRKWGWKNLRPILWFRRGLSGKARDFNWHNVLGLWCALPLFVLALTGAAISYPWLNQGLVSLAGGQVKEGAGGHGPPRGGAPEGKADKGPPLAQRLQGADAALARVARQEPGWQRLTLTVPADASAAWEITADRGNGRQPQHRVEYKLERADLAVAQAQGWEKQDRAQKARALIRFGHTGEIGGWLGQLLAALASLAGAVLAVTGVTLSWRRYGLWKKKRGRAAQRDEQAG